MYVPSTIYHQAKEQRNFPKKKKKKKERAAAVSHK
jgi:hypothetical protein